MAKRPGQRRAHSGPREAGAAPLAVALLAALLFHVDLLVGGGPPAHGEDLSGFPAEPLWIDAELRPKKELPVPAAVEPPVAERPLVGSQTKTESRPAGGPAAIAPRPEGVRGDPLPEEGARPALPAPGSKDEYAPLQPKPGGPGLVYTLPGVLDGLAARPAATAPVVAAPDRLAASKALSGTLAKADAKLGLDLPGAGGVASAVADAVRSATVPADVKATVEVRLDKSGKVTSVRVSKSNGGDAASWTRVAESAKAKLGAKQLDVKGEAATIVVKIDSAMRFPSGSKTQGLLEPICANDILEQIAELLKAPANDVNGPGRGTDASGVAPAAPSPENVAKADALKTKFCIPVGIKGAGDASDIGATAHKVVSATYSVERDGVKALPAGPILPIDTRPGWTPPDPTRTRPDVKGPKPWWQKKRGEK